VTGFWGKPQPAAVLKHEVLRRYVTVYASKTGSQSGGKVTFVDGYAGQGVYDDGRPGSPALAVQLARQMGGYRNLRCVFVERDHATFQKLRAFLDLEAADLDVEARFGAVEDQLDAIISACGTEPLFVFLDPFGVGIDFDMLSKRVLGRSVGGYPKTEVLLNFTVQGLDRIGGLINSAARNRDATLRRMNGTLGGDWWQQVFTEASREDRLAAVVKGYRERLSAAAGPGWGGWTVPVADKIDARPEYLLLHFTQHADGQWEFHEALSHASREWRAACHDAHPDRRRQLEELGQFMFEGLDEPPPFEEDETAWVEEIRANIERLCCSGQAFTIQREMKAVFGRALGIAREKHLRQALKPLWKAGLLANEPKGKLQRYVVVPITPTPPGA
jgi:three-Cys-motif partner protein